MASAKDWVEKNNKEFEKEWEWQRGSQMLKTENNELDWKKVVARHFWDRGAKLGYAFRVSEEPCDTCGQEVTEENWRDHIHD